MSTCPSTMAIRQRKSRKLPRTNPRQAKHQLGLPSDRMGGLQDALRRQPLWIILAVASGACAAFNGVFAKLTTTALTSSLSSRIATLFSLSPDNKPIDILVRAFFFGMNLTFNAAMWALFTAALAKGDSTTRVSIVNVSANFMITAVAGWAIFSESLPPLFWVGAAMLAAGNVVIGRREEGSKPGGTVGLDETREEAEGLLGEDEDADLLELREESPKVGKGREESERLRKAQDADDPI